MAANADLLLPIPKDWSFEEAAQLGIATYTASLCLYHALKLPSPISAASEPTFILVWGGASAVGLATIQLAHLGGLHVIATASPGNFELVKSLGADTVFDYSDEETPSNIKALTQGKLKYAVDCISLERTGEQIAGCIGDEGGQVAVLLTYEQKRLDIENRFLLAYFLLGKVSSVRWRDLNADNREPQNITIPLQAACDKAQYEHRKEANVILTHVLLSGKYRPTPIEVLPRGLESVDEGLVLLKEGKVRMKGCS